jgi:WD40 repeat protein
MKARRFFGSVAVITAVAGCTGLGTASPGTGASAAVTASLAASPRGSAASPSVPPSHSATSAAKPALTSGTFVQIATLPACGYSPAALTGDGKLIVAGCAQDMTTEQLDPATGKVSPVPGDTEAALQAVTLKDGRVFVLMEMDGGAEVFDPRSGKFGEGIDLPGDADSSEIGFNDATILLSDGRVLIVGGDSGSQNMTAYANADLFDPVTGKISRTGSMKTARTQFTAVRLADGRVLVAGGEGGSDVGTDLSTAEIYNPATGKFDATASLPKPRYAAAGALLPGGKVLIAGGSSQDDDLSSAELFDPGTGKYSPTGSMTTARGDHEGYGPIATALPDGRVVVMGGENDYGDPVTTAEIYDPATGKFKAHGSIAESVDYLLVALLQADGTLLVVGGVDDGAAKVWLYQP